LSGFFASVIFFLTAQKVHFSRNKLSLGVVIASLVDFTRLSVCASRFKEANLLEHLVLIILATLAAITGAFVGNKLLKR